MSFIVQNTLYEPLSILDGGGGGGIRYEKIFSPRAPENNWDAHTPALLLMLGSGICFALGLATLKGQCLILPLFFDARIRDLIPPEFSNIKGTVSLTPALLCEAGSEICFPPELSSLKGLCLLVPLFSDARIKDLFRPYVSNIKALTPALLWCKDQRFVSPLV